MPRDPLVLFLGDVVRLRKPHPCGAFEWTVVRLGADIGLRCHGCGHKVLLPRRTLEKRLKAFVSRGPGCGETSAPTAAGEVPHQNGTDEGELDQVPPAPVATPV